MAPLMGAVMDLPDFGPKPCAKWNFLRHKNDRKPQNKPHRNRKDGFAVCGLRFWCKCGFFGCFNSSSFSLQPQPQPQPQPQTATKKQQNANSTSEYGVSQSYLSAKLLNYLPLTKTLLRQTWAMGHLCVILDFIGSYLEMYVTICYSP